MWTAVVGVDGSEAAQRALRWAAGLAEHHGGAVTAVHAYDVGRDIDPRLGAAVREAALAEADEVLARATDELADTGVIVEHEVRSVGEDHVVTALCDAARDADLLVVGSRGLGGFYGLVMGSVSLHTVLHAPGPIAVVPGKERVRHLSPSGGYVLVGLDGSPHAARALDWALDEVQAGGGRLVLAYVGDDWRKREGEEILEQARALVPDGVEVETHALIGTPAEVLVDRSKDARLTVVGSRGRGGFRGMVLGSVGLHLSQYGHSPVVIVRGR